MVFARKQWAVVVVCVPVMMASTMSAANACPPDPAGPQRARIERLVTSYFVARDQGWVNPEQSTLTSGTLGEGAVAPQAVQQAGTTATIAQQIAQGEGLRATEVHTGLAKDNSITIRGRHATATVTTGTLLSWNVGTIGDSSFSDTYVVELERKGPQWEIIDVAYAPIPSTTDVPPNPSAPAAETSEQAQPQLAASGQFDRQAAAAYALRWSASSVLYNGDLLVGDQYNPDYDRARQDNDCTNFASQVLHAGGWPIHDGFDNANPVNWSPDLFGPYGPSRTWSRADSFQAYATDSKRGNPGTVWPNETGDEDIWTLQPGDLIFVDWDPDGHYDGTVDHTMVVSGSFTELGFTEPTYSQHTPHRRNLPLSVGIKIATSPPPPVDPGDGMGGQGRTARFYPVHVHDTFTTD